MGPLRHTTPRVTVQLKVFVDVANGERPRPDPAALQIVPDKGHGNRRSWKSPHGIRRNGRLAIGVAHNVDQQAAASPFLAHLSGPVQRIPSYQFLSNLACECTHLIESGAPVKWHHDVGSEQPVVFTKPTSPSSP